MFVQQLAHVDTKETLKFRITGPLWEESIGDLKVQYCWKRFQVMASSCISPLACLSYLHAQGHACQILTYLLQIPRYRDKWYQTIILASWLKGRLFQLNDINYWSLVHCQTNKLAMNDTTSKLTTKQLITLSAPPPQYVIQWHKFTEVHISRARWKSF